MQGRMEFGPRALGGRSIIGDARSPKMQAVMNLKIKFRESFRPFAPAVLREHVGGLVRARWRQPLHAAGGRRAPGPAAAGAAGSGSLWGIEKLNVPRSRVPAITHVDYSARIQTVRRDTNPLYYDIIDAFHRMTGCPVIVNTSFNVRGEPMVCSPEDAYRCFMRTDMDLLVLENFLLEKIGAAEDRTKTSRGRRSSCSTDASRQLSDKPEAMSLAAYGELLMNLTRREVKGRYSQSLFGAAGRSRSRWRRWRCSRWCSRGWPRCRRAARRIRCSRLRRSCRGSSSRTR